MVLSIPVSSETEERLKARAAASGIDLQTLAARVLEQFASEPPLDEALDPIRQDFVASGMTEEELIDLLEAAKHEMRYGPTGRPHE